MVLRDMMEDCFLELEGIQDLKDPRDFLDPLVLELGTHTQELWAGRTTDDEEEEDASESSPSLAAGRVVATRKRPRTPCVPATAVPHPCKKHKEGASLLPEDQPPSFTSLTGPTAAAPSKERKLCPLPKCARISPTRDQTRCQDMCAKISTTKQRKRFQAKCARIRKKLYAMILGEILATLEAQNRALRHRLKNPVETNNKEENKSPPLLNQQPVHWKQEDVVLVLRTCSAPPHEEEKAILPAMLEELVKVDVGACLAGDSRDGGEDLVSLARQLGTKWFEVWKDYAQSRAKE